MTLELSRSCLGLVWPSNVKSTSPDLDHPVDLEAAVRHGDVDVAALDLFRICFGFV